MDAPLLGAVTRLFVDSVLGWYQRHLRSSTRELAQSGAIVGFSLHAATRAGPADEQGRQALLK